MQRRTAQRTVARSSAAVTGLRLDQEQTATVRFHPAPAGSGIRFLRKDLPGEPTVECCPQNLRAETRWSSLAAGEVIVHHTEHILAALLGAGIDNVLVEVDGDRLPVVTGGSCAGFLTALAEAGAAELDAPRLVYTLRESLFHQAPLDVPNAGAPAATASASEGVTRWLLAQPAATLSVAYVLHVPSVPGMRVGRAEFDESREPFAARLGQARTYFLKLETAGLASLLSSAQRDYIVLDPGSSQALVDEVAEHKIVDLLGDLALLGRPLRARLVAFRTGHRFHHELVRRLVAEELLMLTECP